MLLTLSLKEETVKIRDREALLNYLKSEELKSETIVYDGTSGEYRRLIDIDEIRELALIPEYNQYLHMDTKALSEEKRKRKVKKYIGSVATVVSLALLMLGLLKNIIIYSSMASITLSGSGSSFMKGQMIGLLIGKSLIGVLIWCVIWRWTQKNGKKYPLIIYSIIFLLISLVTLV